jgi:hypothetical protein
MKYPIKQEDEYGCSVACLANFLNTDYDSTKLLFDKDKAGTVGYACKEIVNALSKKGIESNYRYLKPRLRTTIYEDGTIVFIKRCTRYPTGHYLLRSNGKWIDPWVNFQVDKNIKNAIAGCRLRLPGKPIYAIFVKQ